MKKKPSKKKGTGKAVPSKKQPTRMTSRKPRQAAKSAPKKPKAATAKATQKKAPKKQATKSARSGAAAGPKQRKAKAQGNVGKKGPIKPVTKKPAAEERSAAGKKTRPAAAKTSAQESDEVPLPPRPTQEQLGHWAFLTGPQSDEEARAMVDELWLVLNDVEKFRELNHIGNIMGVHNGRKPEKVQLQFRGEAAMKVMSRQWHPTERWQLNPNGILDYSLEIAPCWQLKRWVLGFLDNVRVIGPREFIAVLLEHCFQVMEKQQG